MQLTVYRTKRVQSTVPVCCRRTILACLEAMAKVSTRQASRQLHIHAQVFPDPLSTHHLARKYTKRDLHFILTNRGLPMQFPHRYFLVTIPHKCLPRSVRKFCATLEGIRTRARILPVHPLDNGIPRWAGTVIHFG
jgi:hypothetical protein